MGAESETPAPCAFLLEGGFGHGVTGQDECRGVGYRSRRGRLGRLSQTLSGVSPPMARSGFHACVLKASSNEKRSASVLLSLPDGARRLTNLLHLAELLQARAARYRPGMEGLLRWYATRRRSGAPGAEEELLRLESDEPLVKIVTVHKSKGLEYPIVFCPFLVGFPAGALTTRTGPVITIRRRASSRCSDLGSENYAAASEFAARVALCREPADALCRGHARQAPLLLTLGSCQGRGILATCLAAAPAKYRHIRARLASARREFERRRDQRRDPKRWRRRPRVPSASRRRRSLCGAPRPRCHPILDSRRAHSVTNPRTVGHDELFGVDAWDADGGARCRCGYGAGSQAGPGGGAGARSFISRAA